MGRLAAAGVALALGSMGLALSAQAPHQDPGQRASERLRALQGQAEALLAEEGTLLAQLRGLEIERQRRIEEVGQAGRERAAAEAALAGATARSDALRRTAVEERPEIEGRLVRVYKLGRTGFWRLLLDMDDLRLASRAYRTAAALTRIDRDRIADHQRTLDALAAEQRRLQRQVAAIGEIEARARVARDAATTAVASRAALVAAIDTRRDLNAQLTGELQAAQQRLQVSVAQLGRGATPELALPLKPFQGALPWPARGRILTRFGPPAGGSAPAAPRNGIVIALLEGQSVRAVHEGTVAFADPFTGFGHLVIVQHGDRTYSLYGHLERLSVSKGAHVEALAPIGTSGTDPAGNPALYFELRVDGRAVDPLQWLIRE